MKKVFFIVVYFLIGFTYSQDLIPFKNEILFKVKGDKKDLFVDNNFYYLITENSNNGKIFLNKINKEGTVLEVENIAFAQKNDSVILINEESELVYEKYDKLKFPNNLKFRLEYDQNTYLENHTSIQFKKHNEITNHSNYFDGEIDGFMGVNSVFDDSTYFTSDIVIKIDKHDVVNFIYNEPNHIVVVNNLDKFIGSSGNDLFNVIGSRVYYLDNSGRVIWKTLKHNELMSKKIRAELELGGESLFEHIIFKEKLILFYQLYIVIYNMKNGKYEFLDTKKGPHWKCYYKKIDNKIFEYSNRRIREIDLEKLIMIRK